MAMEARIEELEAQLRDVQAQVGRCMATMPLSGQHYQLVTFMLQIWVAWDSQVS
jgi:hypothetical protein